jgi:hypothetical protein
MAVVTSVLAYLFDTLPAHAETVKGSYPALFCASPLNHF